MLLVAPLVRALPQGGRHAQLDEHGREFNSVGKGAGGRPCEGEVGSRGAKGGRSQMGMG